MPKLAGELHAKNLPLALEAALSAAQCHMEVHAAAICLALESHFLQDIAAVAVTQGPGLAPCLSQGIAFARQVGCGSRLGLDGCA